MIDCRCPSCGSYNTQLAKLAYEKSMRQGKQFESTSAFTQRVAPPSYINPALAIIVGIILWGGLSLIDRLKSLFPEHWLFMLCPDFLLTYATEVSIFVSIAVLFKLLSINAAISRRLSKWYKTWVCHRCGHQWLVNES